MKNFIKYLGSLCILFSTAFGQNHSSIARLDSLFHNIYLCEDEDERWERSDCFEARLLESLNTGTPLQYQYIRHLNYFQWENDRIGIQIFNWGIPLASGQSTYRCIVKTTQKEAAHTVIKVLEDVSPYQPMGENFLGKDRQWWGASYYHFIVKPVQNEIYITLLGWNASNPLYMQKVIDVFHWNADDSLSFGAPVFKGYDLLQSSFLASFSSHPDHLLPHPDYQDYYPYRIIFRYSRKSDMILRYDFQTYFVHKGKKRKAVKENMIVFDRLTPDEPHLLNEYSYYLPVGGTYDAFIFSGNCWVFHPQVSASNPDEKRGRN